MPLELDHFFVCTSPGAPEAEELIRFGLREGEPNTHPGQGTACRRFSFLNAMIEFLWVSDPAEAQSPSTRPTLLWERWSSRDAGASPFGICLRPTNNLPLGAAPRFFVSSPLVPCLQNNNGLRTFAPRPLPVICWDWTEAVALQAIARAMVENPPPGLIRSQRR